MPADTANLMKLMGYVMTPVSLFFTLNFSAGLQLFLLTSGGLQALQSMLLLKPWFRKLVGLPPLVRTVQPAAAPLSASSGSWQAPRTLSTTATTVSAGGKANNVFEEAKSTAKQARATLTQKLKDYSDKGDAKQAIAKAKAYEERRALEEKERYYARMEEQRLKAVEKQQKRL
jgi:YidC/Oxa1 family membrane protein insertase